MSDSSKENVKATLAVTPSTLIELPDRSGFANYRDAALHWFAFGLKVIPISPGTKITAVKWDAWLDALSPWKIIEFWTTHPDHEVGFIVGNDTIVFDADGPESIAALEAIEARFGVTPRLVIKTKKGVHHHYRLAAGTIAKCDSHCTQKYPARIDVKAARGMIILPPSPGKSVQHCSAQSASELSEVGQNCIAAISQHNGRTPPRQHVAVPREPANPGSGVMRVLCAALDLIDPDDSYDAWIVVGAIIFNSTDGGDEGFSIYDAWSSGGSKYKGMRETEAKWNSFKPDHPNPVKIGSLKRLVEANGHSWDEVLAASEPFEAVKADRGVV